MENNNKLIVFEDKKIRRIWHNDEWYFSVVDVTAVLIDQSDALKARKYWNKLSQRLKEEGSEVVTNCHQLKLPAPDGKLRETDCANTKSLFRIIQSIPSLKAEPFKQWLAQVGYEEFTPLDNAPLTLSNGVKEIENPEIGQDRIKEYYELKGYPKDWIDKRLRGIAIRQELTDLPRWIAIQSDIIQRGKWKGRGIEEKRDYAILTNEISKATFGKTVSEYKQFKGIQKKNHNLRDHIDPVRYIRFAMLSNRVDPVRYGVNGVLSNGVNRLWN